MTGACRDVSTGFALLFDGGFSMLESGSALRHTQQEIEWFKEIGIDLSEVQSEADLTRILCEWLEVVSDERPAIIEKLAAALAKRTGLKVPPKLEVVRKYQSSSPKT